MTKHSEGPWNLEHVPTGWVVGPGNIERRNYVADVHEHVRGMPDDEAAANARLIAAAPEMLEALRAMVRPLDQQWPNSGPPITHPAHDAYQAARAAITKAEGK